MNKIDLIGFFGVSLILIAYFLNINKTLEVTDLKYILLNLIGAIFACLASFLLKYFPFVILEGTWTIISLIAFIQYFKNPKTLK